MAIKLKDDNYIARCQHCEKIGVYSDKDVVGHIRHFALTIAYVNCVWCKVKIHISLKVECILHYRRTEASNEARSYVDSFDEDQ